MTAGKGRERERKIFGDFYAVSFEFWNVGGAEADLSREKNLNNK